MNLSQEGGIIESGSVESSKRKAHQGVLEDMEGYQFVGDIMAQLIPQ